MLERTLVVVKPDGVRRRLVGEVLGSLLREGLRVSRLLSARFPRTAWEEFYRDHRGRPYFQDLVDFMASGEVVALVVEGKDAVPRVRALVGPADGSGPGTLRNRLRLKGRPLRENVVHASDSVGAAKREIAILFGRDREFRPNRGFPTDRKKDNIVLGTS